MTTGDVRTADHKVLLDAGAILPPGTTRGDDVDTVTARVYAHPALDDRPVVRLVPGTLGEAEDLALDFLGLVRTDDAPEVGQVRRETLGFPAWALVNDPANGHHALALVKDIERLGRQAKTKPGHAKDGFEALAQRLGRSVPHFLPTFYEQAARAFVAEDNKTYAAVFFGKAREAERVHGLPVEEERLRAVFLEFAFAGALTAKALKEYSKDLTTRLGPKEAWTRFRQLVVERCTAGVPPYAGLAEDTRAMIRAAGGDLAAEEKALLRELVAAPAIARAPLSFWKVYGPRLTELGREETAVRLRLLDILPTPGGSATTAETETLWLDLLAASGAEDHLAEGELPPGAAAGWVSRWAGHRLKQHGRGGRRSARTLAVVARMTGRLREEGHPVELFHGNWRKGVDLDLLDLCLAAGVPVVDPPENPQLDLGRWWGDDGDGRTGLASVAADPRFTTLLREAVGSESGTQERTAAHPVLRPLLAEWLEQRAAALRPDCGLPAFASLLGTLGSFARVILDVTPGIVERVRAFDVAPLLARTLRTGLFDELGWPALEEALTRLGVPSTPLPGGADPKEVRFTGMWPELVVSTRAKVVVVGPEGVLLEHEPRIPATARQWRHPELAYVDGHLLVAWYDAGDWHGYWSNAPTDVFAIEGHFVSGGPSDIRLAVPGGGRTTGARPLHVGDTSLPDREHRLLCDGTSYWRRDTGDDGVRWLEFDPATGATGRHSLPAFLAAAVTADGARLVHDTCELLPLRPGLEDTPLGTDGAILGRWVRREGDTCTAGTPDGRTLTLRPRNGETTARAPLGTLRLPGATPVLARGPRGLALCDDDGTALSPVPTTGAGGAYAMGTAWVPPLSYWHALRPRDEAGSALLRAFTPEQATDLIREVRAERAEAERVHLAERAAGRKSETPPWTRTGPVTRLLPGLAHPGLLAGVAGVAGQAAALADRAARFGEVREKPAAPPRETGPLHGTDREIRAAAEGLYDSLRYHGGAGTTWRTLRQIAAITDLFRTPAADGATPAGDGWTRETGRCAEAWQEWISLLDRRAGLAARALSPIGTGAFRETLPLLLEALAAPSLNPPHGTLRHVELCEEKTDGDDPRRAGQVLRKDGRTVVILGPGGWSYHNKIHWLALDHDPAGTFSAVPGFATHGEHRFAETLTVAKAAALIAAVRELGAPAWRPEAVDAFREAAGIGRGEATLLLAGNLPGELDKDTRAVLGLKAGEAKLAAERLERLGTPTLCAVLGALIPDDPRELWTTGPDIAAAARVWTEHVGRTTRLPEDIAAEATRLNTASIDAVLNPGTTAWITGAPGPTGGAAPVPTSWTLDAAVETLTWLAYRIPYGHPLRPALPHALTALRRRLADPALVLDLDVEYAERGSTAALLRQAEGLPETGGYDEHGYLDIGGVLLLKAWQHRQGDFTYVRPAGFTDSADPWFDRLDALRGAYVSRGFRALRRILDPAFERLLAAGCDPADGAGLPQDPTWSVPELVTEVAKTSGIGEDAAALYLQLLALPDPTDRNVTRWTGWKPARLKKARTELAATGLVLEAKRARAGRSLFLPGGWHAHKAPDTPVETWKDGLDTLVPVPDLFRQAWRRCRDGDAPGFEQLVTRTGRRGRRA